MKTETIRPETPEHNILIAEFMGYEFGVVDYVGTPEETEWQKKNRDKLHELDIRYIGEYFVDFDSGVWFEANELSYITDWNLLMRVLAKLQKIGFKYEMQSYSDGGAGCTIWKKDFFVTYAEMFLIVAVYKSIIGIIEKLPK